MRPERMLKVAHWIMGITLILGLLIIYSIYIAHLPLSIPALVFLHIFFVLLATAFKVSYVVRLTALKKLGRAVN
ncbi:MAG: hypothetical protein EOP48_19170 [Sphingobacteriales bacterium]|nr:MAG: hypothetical protein EOP48_19170 [Sphingobacteriales bacterium]